MNTVHCCYIVLVLIKLEKEPKSVVHSLDHLTEQKPSNDEPLEKMSSTPSVTYLGDQRNAPILGCPEEFRPQQGL